MWLSDGDKAGEGETLNNISALYHAQGDYETALAYLKQSLDICRQIVNKAGLCATLFNIGHMHAQKGEFQQALSAWVTVYVMAKQMNLAQALQALANLAPQLGLPEGLAGWEMLVQRMRDTENGTQREEENELEQIREFVQELVQAHRSKSPQAGKYFEVVSKMAADPNAPPHYRE